MDTLAGFGAFLVLATIFLVAAFFLGGLFLFLFWNFAVVAVFTVPTIGYIQACVASLGLGLFVKGYSTSSK